MNQCPHSDDGDRDVRPFADLRATGLLWLINTTVFHPRGYAIALHLDDEGVATGWQLVGDGNQPRAFVNDGTVDALFTAAKELMP